MIIGIFFAIWCVINLFKLDEWLTYKKGDGSVFRGLWRVTTFYGIRHKRSIEKELAQKTVDIGRSIVEEEGLFSYNPVYGICLKTITLQLLPILNTKLYLSCRECGTPSAIETEVPVTIGNRNYGLQYIKCPSCKEKRVVGIAGKNITGLPEVEQMKLNEVVLNKV